MALSGANKKPEGGIGRPSAKECTGSSRYGIHHNGGPAYRRSPWYIKPLSFSPKRNFLFISMTSAPASSVGP